MTSIFSYDPAEAADRLSTDGYVHLKGLLAPSFVDYLQSFLANAIAEADREAADWKIAGKKRQFVFDFPSPEAAEEFRRGMAALTGLSAETLTVSERHLKVYDDAAEPYPAPHKDRSASHYSIGLPVHLGEGSTVCIFPDLDPGPNQEERAVFLTSRDRDEIYGTEHAVMLNESVGDLVAFLGSALYHERVRGAGTAVLYIKVNDEGDDPLGENIFGDGRAMAQA
ncbi:hypothetical protein DXV76_02130 [Rhodobacteraceae bacterium CCMM004]|nr:hypothetical protein DXV76_02130 [Rhodobacteraceae bacterium CCMM004]